MKMSLQGNTQKRILKRKLVEIKKKEERLEKKQKELAEERLRIEEEIEHIEWWKKNGFGFTISDN